MNFYDNNIYSSTQYKNHIKNKVLAESAIKITMSEINLRDRCI